MAEKVLIIDDDVQSLRLVGLMLERQGFKIAVANNGTQGLRAVRTEQPDIILLDVMMPDMDGYEVARRLRKSPETASIPILMFTARSQVEDKITGYEAGVDDYLTKPIHPAELMAHLKSLLSRQKVRSGNTGALKMDKGTMIGVLGAKGGLGVSTIALNLAIAFQQKRKSEVIAAEMHNGQGSWSTELAYNENDGLSNLLRQKTMDLNQTTVEGQLARMPYGIRLLFASPHIKDAELMTNSEQVDAVADILPQLARMVFLDIGKPDFPSVETILNRCNEFIVVTEPIPTTVQRTRILIEDLHALSFGKSKMITLVSVNRTRADMQMSVLQMQDVLKMNIGQVIPPVPELSFQAQARNVPILQMQGQSVFLQQFHGLAARIAERVPA